MPNITYKSSYYLYKLAFLPYFTMFQYYPQKVCNFHTQVFQIKLKYHCSKPIKLQYCFLCSSIKTLTTATISQNEKITREIAQNAKSCSNRKNLLEIQEVAKKFPSNLRKALTLVKLIIFQRKKTALLNHLSRINLNSVISKKYAKFSNLAQWLLR